METDTLKTCCFLGHRKIEINEELTNQLHRIIENLITEKNVDTFLFGSKSDFDSLCFKVVTELQKKYSRIRRVYVRAEFSYIQNESKHLLKSCDETYFPERIVNAGRAVYVERNYEMIDKSEFCVFYFNEDYLPPRRKNSRRDLWDYQPKSGTAVAFEYAERKKKTIFNVAK